MNELNKCHSLASQILDFNEDYAALNGQVIKEANSVHYCQPGENGESLLISLKDNSILWACNIIPTESHLEAFKRGLRTSKTMLNKITDIKN